jgi:hypothetical protein
LNIYNCQFGFGNEVEGQISYNIYLDTITNKYSGYDWQLWKGYILRELNYKFFTCFYLTGEEPLEQNEQELLDLLSFLNKFNLPIFISSNLNEDQVVQKCVNFHTIVAGVFFGENPNDKELLLFCKE